MASRTKQMDALTALQILQKLDELESDGGSDIELEIDVADLESSFDSDVDIEPPPPKAEPRRRKNKTEPTTTMRQESGRNDAVWVEKSDECM